jgi:hypothetical protein
MSNHSSSEEKDVIRDSNKCVENILVTEVKEVKEITKTDKTNVLKKNPNKYENYIIDKKKELVLDLINFIGYNSFIDISYIKFTDIQNERVSIYINNMLDALKTVFKTYSIRSMARKNKDKRFCLNILRQLLQDIGYTLKMKTYPLIRNNIITSSTKYRIIKKN